MIYTYNNGLGSEGWAGDRRQVGDHVRRNQHSRHWALARRARGGNGGWGPNKVRERTEGVGSEATERSEGARGRVGWGLGGSVGVGGA